MPHIHEKIDFTIEVFIVHKNKVLLRKHDKFKIWLSVGGHIELDEDPNEAALREVKEEVGLEIELYNIFPTPINQEKDYQELIPPVFLNRHRINENHEHICLVYFAKANTDELLLSDKEVTDECKWFSLEDINSPSFNLRENVKLYAKTALQRLAENDKSK